MIPAQTLRIAAAAALTLVPPPAPPPQPTIQRIPLELLATAMDLNVTSASWESNQLSRPQGSFEARSLGNATHDFLELVAARVAAGSSPETLLAELPSWSPRITAVLRASGLSSNQLTRAASAILRSLTHTLADPIGCWLLAPHPRAASELSMSTSEGIIRLDRTFLAGETPQAPGLTHLWIIDFKTGTHGAEGFQAFLAREREKYAPQLESYARHLSSEAHPIRLALYYPALAELLWWPYSPLPLDR